MVSWGGLGGRSPPQESPLPVPCPRALPPIFFRPNFFLTENLPAENFFRLKNFRPKTNSAEKFSAETNLGRTVFRLKNFSVEKFAVRIAEGGSNGGVRGGAVALPSDPPGPSEKIEKYRARKV